MVKIREVGPRDGFQNEPEVIPTDDKVRLVEMLARTGVRRLEVTSFVRADVIPQLADGAEVLRRADIPDEVAVTVLVPNERGLDNALELRERFDEVNLFLSASETHNRKNVNRSIEELSGLERVVARARAEGFRCEGVISVASAAPTRATCPASACSPSPAGWWTRAARRSPSATPPGWPTRSRWSASSTGSTRRRAHRPLPQHPRPGPRQRAERPASGRAWKASSSFGDSAAAVPAGATGNIASEDLVSMLHEMGYETGIDLEKLVACAREHSGCLAGRSGSRC